MLVTLNEYGVPLVAVTCYWRDSSGSSHSYEIEVRPELMPRIGDTLDIEGSEHRVKDLVWKVVSAEVTEVFVNLE